MLCQNNSSIVGRFQQQTVYQILHRHDLIMLHVLMLGTGRQTGDIGTVGFYFVTQLTKLQCKIRRYDLCKASRCNLDIRIIGVNHRSGFFFENHGSLCSRQHTFCAAQRLHALNAAAALLNAELTKRKRAVVFQKTSLGFHWRCFLCGNGLRHFHRHRRDR